MAEIERDADGNWIDPDDAPEWTDEMFDAAEIAIGGKVIRPATGYLGPDGVVHGTPPSRSQTGEKVTLALDVEVIDRFRADGPGWQGRINEALRKAVGLG
ncbi:BrnA antitoxin family protein [uncultured Sphingomonas sp.]|uniref:BrnA antitoxin family protein n=1 Tax=uncultured Sphingomonas sp. TaxID=158754 RepID=UPI0035CB1E97